MNRSTLAAYVAIARPDHWIKNVFVLPGIVLAFLYTPATPTSALAWNILLGMVSVCLVASSNYVINEILDAPNDRKHPEKRHRPVPSGRVSIPLAWAEWLVLYLVGLALALGVSDAFAATVSALWVMGLIYNVPPIRAKEFPWLDVLTEAVNNPIRLLAGWYMVANVGEIPSGSLLLSYWFVGCYFMALKRYSEYIYLKSLGADAASYRASFRWYDEQRLITSVMFYASASMLFFGAFLMRYRVELVLSFPFVAVVMATYMHLAFQDDSPVREPEKLLKSRGLLAATSLCAIVMLVLLVVDIPLATLLTPTMERP